MKKDSGKDRAEPGTTGEGDYYHIEIRPKSEFVTFRYQDVGEPGHIQRLAGKRADGSWDTHSWLISKQDAHIENEKLIPDSEDARNLLAELESKPKLLKGDIFVAQGGSAKQNNTDN